MGVVDNYLARRWGFMPTNRANPKPRSPKNTTALLTMSRNMATCGNLCAAEVGCDTFARNETTLKTIKNNAHTKDAYNMIGGQNPATQKHIGFFRCQKC